MQDYKFSWKPDLPDFRDHLFQGVSETLLTLPPSIDLTPNLPKVLDQKDLGSCVAHAIATAYEYDLIKQKYRGTSLLPKQALFRAFVMN